MKITLPNGTVIESDEAISVGGITIEPIVYVRDEEAPEAEEPVEDGLLDDGLEEIPEEDDSESDGRVVGVLHKKKRYPTEVASLTQALRDAYGVLARYDNDLGVHYSHVSKELDISMAAANARCWMLWRRYNLAEWTAPGKYKVVLLPEGV